MTSNVLHCFDVFTTFLTASMAFGFHSISNASEYLLNPCFRDILPQQPIAIFFAIRTNIVYMKTLSHCIATRTKSISMKDIENGNLTKANATRGNVYTIHTKQIHRTTFK